jgi:hypothetical protein
VASLYNDDPYHAISSSSLRVVPNITIAVVVDLFQSSRAVAGLPPCPAFVRCRMIRGQDLELGPSRPTGERSGAPKTTWAHGGEVARRGSTTCDWFGSCLSCTISACHCRRFQPSPMPLELLPELLNVAWFAAHTSRRVPSDRRGR